MQTSFRAFVVLVTLAIASQCVVAAEESIEPSKLPQGVADALKARFPNAKLTSATKETENNQVVYDIELKLNGLKCESDIKADGTILEIEMEVGQNSWPKALPAAIQGKYPKATINEVMEVSKVAGKKETADHYEVTMTTADKKSKEVIASLDGKTITEEAK